MARAASGGVTASCSPTRIRVGTAMRSREAVVSVRPARAIRLPAMPRGSLASMIRRMPSTASGRAVNVSGANTALTKPSAKAAAPSRLTATAPAARFSLASLPSASLRVSASTRPRQHAGALSTARRATYPPMDRPTSTALAMPRWSSRSSRSSTCPSMVYWPSPTSLCPWPRRS